MSSVKLVNITKSFDEKIVLEDINVVPRSCNTRKAICLYDVNNKN